MPLPSLYSGRIAFTLTKDCASEPAGWFGRPGTDREGTRWTSLMDAEPCGCSLSGASEVDPSRRDYPSGYDGAPS